MLYQRPRRHLIHVRFKRRIRMVAAEDNHPVTRHVAVS